MKNAPLSQSPSHLPVMIISLCVIAAIPRKVGKQESVLLLTFNDVQHPRRAGRKVLAVPRDVRHGPGRGAAVLCKRRLQRAWIVLSIAPHAAHAPPVAPAAMNRPTCADNTLGVNYVSFCLSRTCLAKCIGSSRERLETEKQRKQELFFEVSLCLSRACLGKIITFIYKWLKKIVFSP